MATTLGNSLIGPPHMCFRQPLSLGFLLQLLQWKTDHYLDLLLHHFVVTAALLRPELRANLIHSLATELGLLSFEMSQPNEKQCVVKVKGNILVHLMVLQNNKTDIYAI